MVVFKMYYLKGIQWTSSLKIKIYLLLLEVLKCESYPSRKSTSNIYIQSEKSCKSIIFYVLRKVYAHFWGQVFGLVLALLVKLNANF